MLETKPHIYTYIKTWSELLNLKETDIQKFYWKFPTFKCLEIILIDNSIF